MLEPFLVNVLISPCLEADSQPLYAAVVWVNPSRNHLIPSDRSVGQNVW